MTLANGSAHLFDIERNFWNQDDVGAPGDSAIDGNPARRASHDFDDDHAIVRLGRRVHAIDGFGGNTHGRVEAEGEIGAGQIVVDRFRNAHYFYSVVKKFLRYRKRVVAANGDQRIASMFLEVFRAALQAVRTFGGVGARGAQDSAATRQNARHRRQVELHGFVFQQPAPALHESHKLVFIVKGALAHDRPNDRIESRTVAPARQHSNFHCLLVPMRLCIV